MPSPHLIPSRLPRLPRVSFLLLLLAGATASAGVGGCGDTAGTADGGTGSSGGPRVDGGKTDGSSGGDAGPDAAVATPHIVVSKASGPATNEIGGTVTFTVKLDIAPKSAVTIPLAVSNPNEATLSAASLTFTPLDYATEQTVTVTGKDDSSADGDQPYTVSIGPATGTGSGYEGISAPSISLVNEDDDTAGFFVGNVVGTLSEGGGSATFTVRLRTPPSADVHVPVASANAGEGTTDVSELVFTSANWNVAQTVTVTAVDDDYDDGDVSFAIGVGPATSTDAGYQGKDATDPMLMNADNDTASLVVENATGSHTTERGGNVTFDVRLAARPKAGSIVTVPLSVNDATEGSISPAALTFDTTTWNVPQTVTVTGLPDALKDGPQNYKAMLGASTCGENPFAGLTADVALVNDDDPLSNYTDYSVNHILCTGQSNSTANGGTKNDAGQGFPQFTFTAPHPTLTNITFDTGVFTALGCNGSGCPAGTHKIPVSFIPIKEGDAFLGYGVETISSAMANRISEIAVGTYFPGTGFTKHDVLVSQHGRSGFNYACLRKGGCAWQQEGNPSYAEGMKQVDEGMALAAAAGRSYAVRAVTMIHGEDDHYNYADLWPWPKRAGGGNLADYGEAMNEFQSDYEVDIKAKTGQAQDVPLFMVQMQGWTNTNVPPSDPDYVPPTSSPIPVQQYQAHKRYPKVVLATPGYQMVFNDCLHFNGIGQRRLGEYIARAYSKWVFEGVKWQPTGPQSVSINGAVVTVKYHVPAPPLVLDTVNVAAIANYGFRYLVGGSSKVASGTPVPIQSVAVTAPDTITITLQQAPVGANQRLEYANYYDFNNTGRPGCPGKTTGIRGNVRDSDTTTSVTGGLPLYNWGVSFELPVPYQD